LGDIDVPCCARAILLRQAAGAGINGMRAVDLWTKPCAVIAQRANSRNRAVKQSTNSSITYKAVPTVRIRGATS
jgi:hypothetical protein